MATSKKKIKGRLYQGGASLNVPSSNYYNFTTNYDHTFTAPQDSPYRNDLMTTSYNYGNDNSNLSIDSNSSKKDNSTDSKNSISSQALGQLGGAIYGAVKAIPNVYGEGYQGQSAAVNNAIYGDSSQDPLVRLFESFGGNKNAMQHAKDEIRSKVVNYQDIKNNDNLLNTWDANNIQNNVNYRIDGRGVADHFIAGAQGAAIGLQMGGPWVALAGGIAGHLAQANSFWGANKRAKRLNREIDRANRYNVEGFYDQSTANDLRNIRQQQMNYFQEGGSLEGLNGVTSFNTGGSHEQNPYSGIQQGIASDGLPNYVEEGEIKYNDYIYSARLKPSKKLLKDNSLPEKYAGLTFAEIGKKLQKESEDRPNDPISLQTLDDWMSRLANAQETHKANLEERRLARALDNMPTEDKASLMAGLIQQQIPQEGMDLGQPMYAEGGYLFGKGGPTRKLSEQNQNYVNWWRTHPERLIADTQEGEKARTWLMNNGLGKVIDEAYELEGITDLSQAKYASNAYKSRIMKEISAERKGYEGVKDFMIDAALSVGTMGLGTAFKAATYGVKAAKASKVAKLTAKAASKEQKAVRAAEIAEEAAEKSMTKGKKYAYTAKIAENKAIQTRQAADKAARALKEAKATPDNIFPYNMYDFPLYRQNAIVPWIQETAWPAIQTGLQTAAPYMLKGLPYSSIPVVAGGAAYGISRIDTGVPQDEQMEVVPKKRAEKPTVVEPIPLEYNPDTLTTIDLDDDFSFAEGGSIHIAPSKKGTFTAAATKHGKSVQAFASQVLANKENYSPAMVKKAVFAKNFGGHKGATGLNLNEDYPWVSPMQYYATGVDAKDLDLADRLAIANERIQASPAYKIPRFVNLDNQYDVYNPDEDVLAYPLEYQEEHEPIALNIVSNTKEPNSPKDNKSRTKFTAKNPLKNFNTEDLRYAPAIGAGISALQTALQPVDYEYANALNRLATRINPIAAPTLGGYRRYTPYDINLGDAENLAMEAAALRANRGQNRAAQAAQNIAVINAFQKANAQRNLAAQQANEANRLATDQFNLGIDQTNANIVSNYDRLNTQRLAQRLAIEQAAAQAADAARTGWSNMYNTTHENLYNQLGNIGRDTWNYNQYNKWLEQHQAVANIMKGKGSTEDKIVKIRTKYPNMTDEELFYIVEQFA